MLNAPATEAQLFSALKSVFGFTGFRPYQRDAVDALLAGQDVFLLLPTGGGKSLCYQLPALLMDGVTVVVSPLIALMKDQVDQLQAMGVAATFINSSLDAAEIARRERAVARGQVTLLYVAPERLMQPGFLRLLESLRVALFAIDEAHCISEWGHDFRPEYRDLRRLRQLFPGTPLVALTATATRRVQADIIGQLSLERAAVLRGSFNRPNLYYEVRPKQGAYRQLVAWLRARGQASGIIYCQSRDGTDALAERLRGDGFNAGSYHAGLDADERRQRQEAFVRDDLRIVVATIAFGMGIDKPDVRFVVHYDLPKHLEGFYQESGRAGRDGEPGDCLLYFSRGDAVKHEYFLRDKLPAEQRAAREQLRHMVAWADGESCRRRALLAYFDEDFASQQERCCDVCDDPRALADYTVLAQMFLSCVKRVGEVASVAYIIRVLRGSRDQRILEAGHDRLTTYGIGRERSREEWHALAEEMVRRGYLRREGGVQSAVNVTPLGAQVLFHGEKVVLPELRVGAEVDGVAIVPDSTLFEELRALRKRLADERSVPPFVIFADVTLKQMAAERPRSRAELARIQGVGQRKLADFGDVFLEAIARHGDGVQVRSTLKTGLFSPSVTETLELFHEGKAPSEIAGLRRLALSTVEGHLSEAMEAGERLDVGRLVSVEKQRAITAALAATGNRYLKPVMETLGEGYTFAEIRYVRAALSWDTDSGGTPS